MEATADLQWEFRQSGRVAANISRLSDVNTTSFGNQDRNVHTGRGFWMTFRPLCQSVSRGHGYQKIPRPRGPMEVSSMTLFQETRLHVQRYTDIAISCSHNQLTPRRYSFRHRQHFRRCLHLPPTPLSYSVSMFIHHFAHSQIGSQSRPFTPYFRDHKEKVAAWCSEKKRNQGRRCGGSIKTKVTSRVWMVGLHT